MGLKPSIMLKRLWHIVWLTWLIIGIIFLTALIIIVNVLIFSIILVVFIILMIAIFIWIQKAYAEIEYFIEDDSVKMKWGVVWKKHVTVPYKKVTNVDITQGPIERFLGIGTVHIQTAGAGGQEGKKAELKLPGIKNLEESRDLIVENLGYEKEPVKTENLGKTVLDRILEELKQIHKVLER